jgi:hypothetical protein
MSKPTIEQMEDLELKLADIGQSLTDLQKSLGEIKQKWIDVYLRLPERGGKYLVAVGQINVYGNGKFDKRANHFHVTTAYFHNGEWNTPDYMRVAFWQPLPEPPDITPAEYEKLQMRRGNGG